ncbi:CCD84 protein, partial [Nycticryphes semicollaris]|nr:CCD84 protein [Nycticryphes semicollaris]
MAVHYCDLCRRTSFSGRRHLYSAGHRRRLREALAGLQETVAAARAVAAGEAALRPYDPAEHERRVWPEHRRETARFWREQRAEAALRERVLVPAEEYERFALGLERALDEHRRREEERIQQMAASIRETERRQRQTVEDALQKPPLSAWLQPSLTSRAALSPSCSRDTSQDAEQPGPSGKQTGPDSNWMELGQALTFIGHQEMEGKGNVHTGAKPPWLMEEEEEGSTQEIGPSYEEFLKQKEKQKLKKLPAERVGANFDHTCLTSENWLPSFGRVWNHGRRWQSR